MGARTRNGRKDDVTFEAVRVVDPTTDSPWDAVNEHGSFKAAPELFSLAIGGYGLFGIVYAAGLYTFSGLPLGSACLGDRHDRRQERYD